LSPGDGVESSVTVSVEREREHELFERGELARV
jgi:hypothetical protein